MLVGLENNSWGYHSNGKFYHEGEYDKYDKYDNYGPDFTSDDIIGCYLNFKNNMVFYTRNGVSLGNYYFNSNVI